jgi:DNA polymerase-3 subunit gamma/tau
MDAASHTGVDDVREIIENARFRPVMARYKVYIIDEVHMLSKAAFNALLKTLEEPPPHVKFLFATTEIDKVPVTVRSRCIRFDLRRIEPDVLINHLRGICDKEAVAIDADALALIVRASEGSVRDALSLLDQAIAHGASIGHDTISAASLRDMLGVADRARVIDMFEALMKGEVAPALAILKEQYDLGADPYQALVGLAEFVHFVTRFKLVPDTPMDASMSSQEFTRGSAFAKLLTLQTLTRAWQILMKGLQDIKDSPRPMAAADMVLVRLAYAADLPNPEDVLKRLQNAPDGVAASRVGASPTSQSAPVSNGGARPMATASAVQRQPMARTEIAPTAAAGPRVRLLKFEDVVTLAAANRDIQLKIALEQDVRIVRFAEQSIEFSLVQGASSQVAQVLTRRLQEWTGVRWIVTVSREDGGPTLKEVADERARDRMTGARAIPLVRSVLERFPGAEIVAIRSGEDDPPPTTAAIAPVATTGDDEVGYIEDVYTDDDL